MCIRSIRKIWKKTHSRTPSPLLPLKVSLVDRTERHWGWGWLLDVFNGFMSGNRSRWSLFVLDNSPIDGVDKKFRLKCSYMRRQWVLSILFNALGMRMTLIKWKEKRTFIGKILFPDLIGSFDHWEPSRNARPRSYCSEQNRNQSFWKRNG